MKCSSRLTTCLVSALLIVVVTASGVEGAQPEPTDEAAVRLALIRAIQSRMGASAAVRLEQVRLDLDVGVEAAAVTAVPDPGSRIGRPVRFALTVPIRDGQSGSRRVGGVVATVYVSIEHVRLASAVPRGAILADTDLAMSHEELGTGPFGPVPVLADVVGSRAVRDLLVGEVVTAMLVRAQPLVKSGETVRTRIRFGRVEAVGQAVAQQSGHRNDRIRLINPESRRPLFGRVTGPGEVEVIHAR